MQLVKIGSRFVNLGQVTHIETNPVRTGEIILYFAASLPIQIGEGLHGIELNAEESQTLSNYLNWHSIDAVAWYRRNQEYIKTEEV